MTRRISSIVLATLVVFCAGHLSAQDLYVYPNQGQNDEKQEQDQFQCYTWARDETSFDPMQAPRASTPPPQSSGKEPSVARSAVGGAALGAIVGDSSDAALKGAAAGALMGGWRKSKHRKEQQQAQDQWANQQAQQYQAARNHYNRAYAACLEGRGYTVR